jgi:ribosome-binding protein aMBF1 (putative translation factor)
MPEAARRSRRDRYLRGRRDRFDAIPAARSRLRRLSRQTLTPCSRASNSLTQAKLAKKLRRPQSYVSKYERGDRRLDVIEFLEVARAVGFDPSEFLRKL